MRIIVAIVAMLLMPSCVASSGRSVSDGGGVIELDGGGSITYPIVVPQGTMLGGGEYAPLFDFPPAAELARRFRVRRGQMLEWGAQCAVDVSWKLAACRVTSITPELMHLRPDIIRLMNGQRVAPFEHNVGHDILEYRAGFRVRNAIPEPVLPLVCYAGRLCPFIHINAHPPLPPPPPPPSSSGE